MLAAPLLLLRIEQPDFCVVLFFLSLLVLCVRITLLSLRIYLGPVAACHFILYRDFCFIGGFMAFEIMNVQMLLSTLFETDGFDFFYIHT